MAPMEDCPGTEHLYRSTLERMLSGYIRQIERLESLSFGMMKREMNKVHAGAALVPLLLWAVPPNLADGD